MRFAPHGAISPRPWGGSRISPNNMPQMPMPRPPPRERVQALGLLVALVVQRLENQDLEHEQGRIGLASCGGGVVASQGFFDDGEKALPIHDAVQSSQGVNLLIELFQEDLFIEESGHHGRSPGMGGQEWHDILYYIINF